MQGELLFLCLLFIALGNDKGLESLPDSLGMAGISQRQKNRGADEIRLFCRQRMKQMRSKGIGAHASQKLGAGFAHFGIPALQKTGKSLRVQFNIMLNDLLHFPPRLGR